MDAGDGTKAALAAPPARPVAFEPAEFGLLLFQQLEDGRSLGRIAFGCKPPPLVGRDHQGLNRCGAFRESKSPAASTNGKVHFHPISSIVLSTKSRGRLTLWTAPALMIGIG